MYGTLAVPSCLESKAKQVIWKLYVCVVGGDEVGARLPLPGEILTSVFCILVSWTGGIFHRRLFTVFSGGDNPSFQCPRTGEEGEG